VPAEPPGSTWETDASHERRLRRRRSSRALVAALALGALAACLVILPLLAFRDNPDVLQAKAKSLAVLATTLAAVLLLGALWHRRLMRGAHRDCVVLERKVDALRRREAYEQSQAALMARISDLIEVFTHTRNLEAVLNEAVRTLHSTLSVSCLMLQLYDDETGGFTLSIVEGGEAVDLGDEVRRDVIERGRSRLVNQLTSSGQFPALAAQGYSCLMVAPLGRGRRATDRSIGLIAALDKRPRDFTGQELGLLAHFARHAGLIIENAQLYKRAEHLAEHDGLTDLYNQRRFMATLTAELAKSAQLGAPVALIFCDLDNFKHYNDTHGHPKGDIVLRQVAKIMTDNTRRSDIVARYGGEEFAVILPGTGHHGAQRVAEAIRSRIEQFTFEDESRPGTITLTLGIAVFPHDAASAEALIQRADDALYRGKHEGKNRVVWASPPPVADASPPPEEPAL